MYGPLSLTVELAALADPISLLIAPGKTHMTSIPNPLSSIRKTSLKDVTDAFVAQYAGEIGGSFDDEKGDSRSRRERKTHFRPME